MKTALVHDWLNQIGGAESVLESLVSMYPDAPVYTSIFARDKMPPAFGEWDVRTLWMDNLPLIHDQHQPYLPLYPAAFGNLDMSDYDLVISNKSGFCHGIKTGHALHICYCLAPTRYVWQFDSYIQGENLVYRSAAPILRRAVERLKSWDYRAAQKVGHFIAISSDIQRRIAQFYNRESTIIYPPVDTQRFDVSVQPEDYFLVVSRLIPYKRVDLAVQACTELDLPLIVCGSGRDHERLESMAGPTVTFKGRVSDDELPSLMARCKAFIFPGLEDFGIAPVEAQAAGRPVIAFRGGGALDTIVEGKTGLFFDNPNVKDLCLALNQFADMRFSPDECRQNASRFESELFKRELAGFIEKRYDDHRKARG